MQGIGERHGRYGPNHLLEPVGVYSGRDQRGRQVPGVVDAMIIKPVGEPVFGLTDLHRRQLLRLGHPLHSRLLELGKRRQSLRVDVDSRQVRQLAPHPADEFPQ